MGELTLILDTELIAPTRALPPSFRRVGPIAWTPEGLPPPTATLRGRDRALVYLTMGSTGNPELMRVILATLAAEDHGVVVSTAGQVDLGEAGRRDSISVSNFVAGEQVMAMADLAIFHGGAGTGYQAIRSGTPAIGVATHLEQEFMGEALEEQGAGIFLTMRQVLARPRVIVDAIAQILQHRDRYHMNVARLREDLLRYDPVSDAADAIEVFLARGPREAPLPAVRGARP